MDDFQIRKFEDGQVIFREGTPGNRAYLIKSGSVKITKKDSRGVAAPVALLKAGEIFGETAILQDDDRRTATAAAAGDSELVEIGREHFLDLLDRSPRVIAALTTALAGRLKATTECFSSAPTPLFSLGEILTLLFYDRADPFPYALVVHCAAKILAVPTREIQDHLDRLVEAGLVHLADAADSEKMLSLKNRATLVDEIKML